MFLDLIVPSLAMFYKRSHSCRGVTAGIDLDMEVVLALLSCAMCAGFSRD